MSAIIHVDLSAVGGTATFSGPKAKIDAAHDFVHGAIWSVLVTSGGYLLFSTGTRRIYLYDTRTKQTFYDGMRLVAGSGEMKWTDEEGSDAAFKEPGSLCLVGAGELVTTGTGTGVQQQRWLLLSDCGEGKSIIRRLSVDPRWFPLPKCCEADDA